MTSEKIKPYLIDISATIKGKKASEYKMIGQYVTTINSSNSDWLLANNKIIDLEKLKFRRWNLKIFNSKNSCNTIKIPK